MAATWTDYAILEPSVPKLDKKGQPVAWKVQINGDGKFRCSCPSYIFSKQSPKTCKHLKKVEEEQLKELRTGVVNRPGVAAPAVPANYAEATAILLAMLAEAKVDVRPHLPLTVGSKGAGFITKAAQDRMVGVLAQRLAIYVPPTPVPSQTETIGVRRITFDD